MSKIALAPNASGTGTLTVAAPNTNSDYTLTLPAETGTVLTSGGAIDVNASAPADSVAISSAGNVGVGTTSPSGRNAGNKVLQVASSTESELKVSTSGNNHVWFAMQPGAGGNNAYISNLDTAGSMIFTVGGYTTERMRIDSSGKFLVQMGANSDTATGMKWDTNGADSYFKATHNSATSGNAVAYFNRQNSDGTIVGLQQADTTEGSISVSGTTVSYNGGHLSRWAQTTTAKDESLKKGTVLSNLDEMNVYTDAEGNPVDNEQLNKVKVSDVEGDVNVAGVFVNWTYDEAHEVDEINMAMTGDMIIRIAQGVTVQRGDLLMSAGDGTAKPQEDDIVRSKTVAKVTSTHVTCTYEDGSYCVPCVLMAC